MLEKKLTAVYDLYGKAEHSCSMLYQDTGHEYLPEMKEAMAAWFEQHLPMARRGAFNVVEFTGGFTSESLVSAAGYLENSKYSG